MRYLHTMIRVSDLDASVDFFTRHLGMVEIDRKEVDAFQATLVFLAAAADVQSARDGRAPLLELTYNWKPETYSGGRNFGHLAYEVDDIYEFCQKLQEAGITLNKPPRDGRMAFFRTPDGISIELLQKGGALEPREPWVSQENVGSW